MLRATATSRRHVTPRRERRPVSLHAAEIFFFFSHARIFPRVSRHLLIGEKNTFQLGELEEGNSYFYQFVAFVLYRILMQCLQREFK